MKKDTQAVRMGKRTTHPLPRSATALVVHILMLTALFPSELLIAPVIVAAAADINPRGIINLALHSDSAAPGLHECNHGVAAVSVAAVGSMYDCACACFDGYLQPSCLYQRDDPHVPMKLWWRRPRSENRTHFPLMPTDAAIAATLQRSLGLPTGAVRCTRSEDLTTATAGALAMMTYRSGAAPPETETPAANHSILLTQVTMPGWAAQQLLADAAHHNLDHYTVHPALCSAPSDNDVVACGVWQLFAVRDAAARGQVPAQPPLYVSNWLRLYATASRPPYYVSLPQCGWVVGALLLVTVVGLVECCGSLHAQRARHRRWGGRQQHAKQHSQHCSTTSQQVMRSSEGNDNTLSTAANSSPPRAARSTSRTPSPQPHSLTRSQSSHRHHDSNYKKYRINPLVRPPDDGSHEWHCHRIREDIPVAVATLTATVRGRSVDGLPLQHVSRRRGITDITRSRSHAATNAKPTEHL